ncbi:endonuclease [Flavobacterium sp.]|uniref:endonuclease n=1 Tax=Flavobacterium sp. TaxID=239 RepID=UPI0039E4EA02
MRKIYTLALLLTALIGFAQPPAGYYNSATGTGYTLKTQLKNIITNGHNPQSYTTGLWNLYNSQLRDHWYENDNSLLDIYSENPTGSDPYNYTGTGQQCGNYSAEGDCYNKEHLIPQSYFSSAMPMYSDAHHVVPSDGKVNGWRNNLAFGDVGNVATNPCNNGATNTPCNSQNGSKKGANMNSGYAAGFSGIVFEPIDEFKGDIARSFFYFATRYETQMAGFYTAAVADPNGPEVTAMFDGSNNKVFSDTFLNILLTWNQMDPVSPKEIAFNNAIYNFQGNRNPYIDNNNYVTLVWGLPLATENFDAMASVSVYPNPTVDHKINISGAINLTSIQLISVTGQLIRDEQNPVAVSGTYTLENLPQGLYLLKLASDKQSTTKKLIVN